MEQPMRKQPIHFYDAATPENVPSGVYAAYYVNGFVWPQSQIRRMARVFGISVRPDAFWARFARCLDIERGAANPSDLVPFMHERAAHVGGFHDVVAYVNRSNWSDAQRRVQDAGLPAPLWWVATLDGTDIQDCWACQQFGHPGFDLSVLHGVDNFRKP